MFSPSLSHGRWQQWLSVWQEAGTCDLLLERIRLAATRSRLAFEVVGKPCRIIFKAMFDHLSLRFLHAVFSMGKVNFSYTSRLFRGSMRQTHSKCESVSGATLKSNHDWNDSKTKPNNYTSRKSANCELIPRKGNYERCKVEIRTRQRNPTWQSSNYR